MVKAFLLALIISGLCGEVRVCCAEEAPARRALIIGNDAYPGKALMNARNDARSVDEILSELGYSSMLALDVTRSAMGSLVDRFVAGISQGDTVFVYYAGHGVSVRGENYLVPVDFHASDETDVADQGYSLSVLLSKLTEHGALTQVVILDSCRDNPFISSRSIGGGWAGLGSSAGTFLAFGTAPGSTASDDPEDGHGLFTKALIKHLRSSSDIERMFQDVRQDVIKESSGTQVPWISSSLIGMLHVDPKEDVGAHLPVLSRSAQRTTSFASSRSSSVSSSDLAETKEARRDRGLNEAITYARGFHYTQALTVLETVLAIDPQFSPALRVLGLVLRLVGRNVEASDTLAKAVQNDATDARGLAYLCLIEHAEMNSPSRCNQSLALRTDLPEAHLGMALALAKEDRLRQAAQEVTTSISLDPTAISPYVLRGAIANVQGKRGMALSDYQKATSLSLEPHSVPYTHQ